MMILPQANLKAKDLPKDLLPSPQILKSYKDANQEFDFNSDASTHDRTWRWFCSQTNGNTRIATQEIEQRINRLYRIKNSNGEFLYYTMSLFGLNHIGEPVDFCHTEGKIDQIPVFEKKTDENTGEVVYGPLKRNHKTVYTIPFSKKKVDELSKYFADSVGYAVIDRRGQRQSCDKEALTRGGRTLPPDLEGLSDLEIFRDLQHEELIKLTNSYKSTPEYRNKQLVEANTGGIK